MIAFTPDDTAEDVALIPAETWDAAREPAPLRIADRCDRCGAQAFARARIEVEVEPGVSGPVDLLFCGHHFRKHEDALKAVASEIVDERHRINARPSPSD